MNIVSNIKDIKKIRGIARHGEVINFSAIIGLDDYNGNVVFPLNATGNTINKEWVLFLVDRELKELAEMCDREILSSKLSLVKVEKDAVYINKNIESIKFEDFDDLYIHLLVDEKDFREASYIPISDLYNLLTYLLHTLHIDTKIPESGQPQYTLLSTEVFVDPKTKKEMVGFFYACNDKYNNKIVYELYEKEDTDSYLNKFFPIFKEDMNHIVEDISEELEIEDLSKVEIETKLIYPNNEGDLYGFNIILTIKQDGKELHVIEKPLFFESYSIDINTVYDRFYEDVYLAFLKYIKGDEYK